LSRANSRPLSSPPTAPVPAPALTPAPAGAREVPSFAQERLWFLDRLQPGLTAYNMPHLYRVRGDLDVPALRRALTAVAERHEALRTTFREVDGQPRLVLAPPGPVPLPRVDLSTLAPEQREARGAELAREALGRPFDLAVGPLFRAGLVTLAPEDHQLWLSVHHIISDGGSMGIFLREWLALYAAFHAGVAPPSAGVPPPLPPLPPLGAADCGAWQRRRLSGEGLEDLLAWWRQELADAPERLELPTDRPSPPTQTFRGSAVGLKVPPALRAALTTLPRGDGAVTPFMIFLAAWQVLLARISGQDDVLVGYPVAGRTAREMAGLIGFFANTLVLRTRSQGDPPFTALLGRVRSSVLGALEHQEMPLERLVEELGPRRDLGYSPLFQVMFAFQQAGSPEAGPGEVSLPGLSLSPQAPAHRTAKFDLTLTLADTGEDLLGSLEYRTDLFDATTVHRLARAWLALLAGIAADCRRRLSALPLLEAPERHQLLVEWNEGTGESARGVLAEGTLPGLLASSFDHRPEAIALTTSTPAGPGEALSYGELRRRGEGLARALAERGVGPEEVVGLLAGRSLERVVALVGIVLAGGAYLGLDPDQPWERSRRMLTEAAAKVVLADRELPGGGESHGIEVRRIRDCPGEVPPLTAVGEERLAGTSLWPENLAYLSYTSGSTGQPKGVAVPQRGVVRLVAGRPFAPRGPGEVYLHLAPVHFDASTFEIWGALVHGGRLAVFPEGPVDPRQLGAFLVREGVSVAWLTAGLFHPLVEAEAEALRGLGRVLAGGDVLSPTAVRVLLGEGGKRRLKGVTNGYGPTENTTFTTTQAVDFRDGEAPGPDPDPLLLSWGRVAIGRPLEGTRVYVLGRRGQVQGVGVPGELHAGGAGLARGYYARPGATAALFVPAPTPTSGGRSGERLYRTGDRVRTLVDGRLDFLGRIDRQVKIRGFRVEPGEVEEVLRGHPGVRAVAVVAVGPAGGRRLAAGLVPTAEGGAEGEAVRGWLRERLPEHLVPSTLTFLDTLPLTPTGKVDRQALEASLAAGTPAAPPGGATHVAPATPLESQLARIWAEVLDLPRVSTRANFFDLGGDSLLAIQVVSRTGVAGIPLGVDQLFRHPTVAELAAAVERGMGQGGATLVLAEQGPVTGPVPQTPGPAWFFDRVLGMLGGQAELFATPLLLAPRPAAPQPVTPQPAAPQPLTPQPVTPQPLAPPRHLTPGELVRMVRHLTRHHDALRLACHRRGEVWELTNLAPGGPEEEVPLVDLSALATEDREGALLAAGRALRATLDLGGPLARFALFRMDLPESGARGGLCLLALLHHLISDGVSWRLLHEDLETLGRQSLAGEPPRLPPKTTSLKAWARHQERRARSLARSREVEYWEEVNREGARDLPVDFPGGRGPGDRELAAPGGEGRNWSGVHQALDPETTRGLVHLLPGLYRVPFTDALLAALVWAFHRQAPSPTGRPSLLLRVTDHGRQPGVAGVDLSRTVGWITTTSPLLLTLGGDETPAEALAAISEQIRRVPSRGIGYGLLRYLSGDPEVEARMAALVASPAATFNFLGRFDVLKAEDVLFTRLPLSLDGGGDLPRKGAALRIAATVAGDPPRLGISWGYNEDFWRRETITRLAKLFEREIQRLVETARGG